MRSTKWNGKYHRCGVWGNDTVFPAELQTYHRRLRDEAGYHVVGCDKFHTGHNADCDGRFAFGASGNDPAALASWGFSRRFFSVGKNQAIAPFCAPRDSLGPLETILGPPRNIPHPESLCHIFPGPRTPR
jgi:hypothetical protein